MRNLNTHPHFEGKLRLIEDNALSSEVVDAVIMGCDAFSEDLDWMINKIGSTNIMASARAIGVPVFVLTNNKKISTDKTISSDLLELVDLRIFNNVSFITD